MHSTDHVTFADSAPAAARDGNGVGNSAATRFTAHAGSAMAPRATASLRVPVHSVADRLRGELMAQSLAQLLNMVPGAREVLPHLAALERGLVEQGAAAIGRIAPHWLHKICSQLSSLPMPDQDPPLHDLLDRLFAEMRAHQGPPRHDSMYDLERTVVIRQCTHSQFEAARDEMATTRPGLSGVSGLSGISGINNISQGLRPAAALP